ncbi:MAG: hypothetical protein JNJ90_13075 [Saprospiraceae bacterium]|jgi:hypothetical protein|nr:hypothetical protein [Saprospiraceae bacterium]
MGTIVSEGPNLILTIPRELLSEKEIQKLLDLLRFYELINKSAMTEKKAWQLSEEIKSSWWEANKERILAKIEAK